MIVPAASKLPTPILAWFYTVWFIVSAAFLLGSVVFGYIGFKPDQFASNQLAAMLVALYAGLFCTWNSKALN